MPRSYQKSPLEHFVEVLERERPLGRMAAVWP
jgi:hypothetical protein